MPLFRYKAKDPKGETITGTMDAENRAGVISRLQSMDYFPLDVVEEAKRKDSSGLHLWKRRIRASDICEFYRQMADLIQAGIALVKALQIVVAQTPCEPLRAIIAQVTADVQGGDTFAEALGKHPKVFLKLAVALIQAGEKGGFLPDILQQLAGFAEMEEELKGKVRSALYYPAVMVFVGISAVSFLMGFVIPKIIDLYKENEQELPQVTQTLIFISDFLTGYWYLLIGGLVLAFVVSWRFAKTKEGKRLLDTVALRLPLFGDIILKREISRFARTLGRMLENGVPILAALEIVADVAANTLVRELILEIPADIAQGSGMSGSLRKHDLFPPGVVNMISIGEETGSLPQVLQRIAPSFEAQVDRSMKGLTSLIEPVIILCMGVIVGFIVIAMLLPILTLDPTGGM